MLSITDTGINWLTKRRTDCLESLKIPEAGVRYQQVIKNHGRTFGWLFEKNTIPFLDWLSEARDTGPAGRLFWITGKPGSGKSTIMKHAIRNSKTIYYLLASKTRTWHIIPFFFSDRGSEKQSTFQTMLQEILFQLLRRVGDSFHLVHPLYKRLRRMQTKVLPKWDTATLCEGILEVISKSGSKLGICLFIDALDEHNGDNESLCRFLWDLSGKSEGSLFLKICFTSRPWPVFQKYFQYCKGFVINEHTENDIRHYVVSRLHEASESIESRQVAAEDQMQEETAISALAEDVTKNAHGVFIWARLVIDELCQGLIDKTPIAMLRESLTNIPHELEDFYARALSKVRPAYAAEAHIVLHMVLSSLSPLPTQTLLDCTSWLLVDRVDPQKPEDQASRLASITGNLLETVNGDGSPTIQFIHQTVKEYLRSHGDCLSLKYMDRPFERGSKESLMLDLSSPLQPITGDEFRKMEGSEFLLLCGVRQPFLSGPIIPHLFAYAKKVDNKLPQLSQNRQRRTLDTLSSLLDDESVWQGSWAYISLKSSIARPSRLELAIAANLMNTIREFDDYDSDFTRATLLAALGPSVLGDLIDRVGMIQALVDGCQRFSQKSRGSSGQAATPPSIRALPAEVLSQPIKRLDRIRMLKSVGAYSRDVISKTTLLTTLISIENHPFVSERERIEIAVLLLQAGVNLHEQGEIIMHSNGRNIYFRSVLSFCFHFGSVGWMNMFLEKSWKSISSSSEERESLAHCLASNRGCAHPSLRAVFLQEVFGKDEKGLRPIPDDEEEGRLGVGWPLIWLGSQCGIVGFPHLNRGFCSSAQHRRATRADDKSLRIAGPDEKSSNIPESVEESWKIPEPVEEKWRIPDPNDKILRMPEPDDNRSKLDKSFFGQPEGRPPSSKNTSSTPRSLIDGRGEVPTSLHVSVSHHCHLNHVLILQVDK